jgi:uncharacterized protein (DUF2235 family)
MAYKRFAGVGMPKNVVLCCDGTANEFAEDRTNVIKLFGTLAQDPSSQVTYYHPGLGTMEAPGALTPLMRRATTTLGQAVGYGLERDIGDAYVFLMRNYEPDDKVFLFGFSRGAYTVRAVASLLRMYGVIRHDNEAFVPYAIRMLMSIRRGETQQDPLVSRYFELANEFKRTMTRVSCRPWFVGLWDTVSSVGWIENPLHLPYVSNNPDIVVGRHAVAIDERRAFFRTELWTPDPTKESGPKDLKQVWFPGVHCDVGGGYAEPESGLSKIALEWMLREAKAHHLVVDADREADVLGIAPGSHYARADAHAPMHESLAGMWELAEYVPKRHFDWNTHTYRRYANHGHRRVIPPQSLVHVSAFERGGGYADRLPADAIRVS